MAGGEGMAGGALGGWCETHENARSCVSRPTFCKKHLKSVCEKHEMDVSCFSRIYSTVTQRDLGKIVLAGLSLPS